MTRALSSSEARGVEAPALAAAPGRRSSPGDDSREPRDLSGGSAELPRQHAPTSTSASIAAPVTGDGAAPEATVSGDLTAIVGHNLRRLRVKRGLSLERLARASGVSRAMLGQVELGQSTPTINVLWKVARALDVSFSTLLSHRSATRSSVLPASRSKVLASQDGTFRSRALFPFDEPRTTEFYELRLAAHAIERADPHPAGTTENLVVASGALTVHVDSNRFTLNTGDAVFFEADVPHEYHNPGEVEAVMYLVMTYV